MVSRWGALELMRACDTSLEPPRLPYDQVMEQNRFARAVRPQRAKMCFLLHKLAPNGSFEILDNKKKSCRVSRTNDLDQI